MVATSKLSSITTTTINPATSDYAVSVLYGSTDTLVTYSQIATTVSPIITLVSSQIPVISLSSAVTGVLPQVNGGESLMPMYVNTASTYYSTFQSNNATGGAMVAGSIYFMPVWIGTPLTIQGIGFNIGTTGSGGVFNAGFYTNSGNRPGNLLASGSGSTSTTAGTMVLPLTGTGCSITAPGWYWTAFQAGDTTMRVTSYNSAGSIFSAQSVVGTTSLTNALTGLVKGVSFSGSVGAAMVSAPTTFLEVTSNIMPFTVIQIKSIP